MLTLVVFTISANSPEDSPRSLPAPPAAEAQGVGSQIETDAICILLHGDSDFFTDYSLRIKCDLFFRLFTVTSLILAVIFFFNLPCFSHSCSFPVWSQWDRMPNNMAKIADARKTVEQLKLEVNIERMMVSRCGGMVGRDHALQQEGHVFRFSWSTAPP